MAHGQGHSVDEYLETIYFLAFPIGEYRPWTALDAIAARVAEMLGVSRASAGEMLKRLEADGLVERGEHKEAILTPTGIERAEHVVRKHRIIERLLTDFMGYTAAESHVHADELGDTFTDDMVERIERAARPPRPLPARLADRHGVRAGGEPRARLALRARPRRQAEIVRLAEHDGDLLHWFYDEASCPARWSSAGGSEPRGAVRGPARRRREDDRREGRAGSVRAAGCCVSRVTRG